MDPVSEAAPCPSTCQDLHSFFHTGHGGQSIKRRIDFVARRARQSYGFRPKKKKKEKEKQSSFLFRQRFLSNRISFARAFYLLFNINQCYD